MLGIPGQAPTNKLGARRDDELFVRCDVGAALVAARETFPTDHSHSHLSAFPDAFVGTRHCLVHGVPSWKGNKRVPTKERTKKGHRPFTMPT